MSDYARSNNPVLHRPVELALAHSLRQSQGGSTPKSAATGSGGESVELREAHKRIKLLEQENEVLRRAAAYLSQAHLPGNDVPARPRAGRRRDTVTVTCRVLKIARQPYYRWLADPVTSAELTAAYRANALFDAHRDDPEFGYRFLVDEAREAGEQMAERTAWKLCSQLGWFSAFGKKRAKTARKPGPRSMTLWSSATSPPTLPISCG